MKRSLILCILALAFFFSMVPFAQAANSPSLNGLQIFPEDNIWNTRVDTMPVDAKSSIYITDLVKDTAPYGMLRHYISTAIPYNVVTSSQSHQYITQFSSLAYSDNVAYPIPANPLYELGCNDHHMEIIDIDEMKLYELYAVSKQADGTWHAGSGAVWDLESNKFRKNNVTPMWATDEAGLPIFPGLVRYDEVSSGQINHALRIAVPALQNKWIWPARTSSPLPGVSDPTHPPAGQRFRLKSSFDISGYPPQAKVILQALKTYGAMATTMNGKGNPVNVIGSPDTRWNYADLNTLYNVKLTDFEAVDVSSLMIDPNSAQARQPGVTPTPTSSTITVTSPDGGETWVRGTSKTITWDYTGSPGSTVKIVLMQGATEAGTIASSVSVGSSGQGSYTWPIYATGSTGSDFRVSVQSISQPAIKDVSNNFFTLAAAGTTTPAPTPTPTASISVTSPDGGETWVRGTSKTITWDYTGSPGSTVKIVLLKGSTEAGTIASSVSVGSNGHGSYTWPIYATGSTGSDFRVSVQSISQPDIKDVSNNFFTLAPAGTTTSSTSITVTSPDGGETWVRGTSKTITWDYTGSPGSTVKIVLLKGSTEAGTIASSVSVGSNGHGSYTWPIYATGSTGSDYKVSIQSTSQPAIKDVSNNFFTLAPAGTTSSASITVTSPNGGESWKRGTTHSVTWDYTGSPGSTVKIVLLKGSTEAGTIASSVSVGSNGHGSYTWPIYATGSTGSDYKVSVQSTSQTAIKDVSNNFFTLTL